jgi:ABC-type dipeptide/oligopeptide/nickel transport system permease subunit
MKGSTKEFFDYSDSYNSKVEISIDKSKDFEFVQKDQTIKDIKLHGKPTTFFKDSMKRFVKNKSSVMGGVILGVLIIMAIFVPVFMPNEGAYNLDTTQIMQAEMPPKLFDDADGFWDGTIKREGYAYDVSTGLPAGYTSATASKVEPYSVVENKATQYGDGGSMIVYNPPYTGATSNLLGVKSSTLDFDFTNDYRLNVSFNLEQYSTYKMARFRILLVDSDSSDFSPYYFVSGSLDDYGYIDIPSDGNYSVDIKQGLDDVYGDFAYSSLDDVSLFVGVEPDKSQNTYILLSSLSLSSSDEAANEKVSKINFIDGNSVMLESKQIVVESQGEDGETIEESVPNPAFWTSNISAVGAYGVNVHYCNFLYDKYEEVYGDKTQNGLSGVYITLQIKYDFISFDFSNRKDDMSAEEIASRLTILNDMSPVREILAIHGTPEVSYNADGSIALISGATFDCVVSQYRSMGYSSMPKFIFGTNAKGQDFFKKIFSGLRLSLLIAFGVAFVNIIIGLVWGSISGYFGGRTDIIMERICDIIGGLPTMVIITLTILYAHNDILAMMIALFMTGWMGVSGRTRTQFYRFKGMEYVLASRTLGAKDARLIFKHILPNSLGTIITSSILMIPGVMYTEASIAYLGLGLKDMPLFGVILSEGNAFFQSEATFLLVIPTIIMMLLMICFNAFGNGLRDAFNPSLKGSE